MSAPTFLDAGAIYALADRNDIDHAAVKGVYGERDRKFLLHELILVEAFSLLTKRLHKGAALATIGALRRSPRVEIVPVSSELLEVAWARCERFADKEWDWVDCASFEIMERRGLRESLAMDRHFTQAGFVLLV